MAQLGHWKIFPLAPPPVKAQLQSLKKLPLQFLPPGQPQSTSHPQTLPGKPQAPASAHPLNFRGQGPSCPKNAFYHVPLAQQLRMKLWVSAAQQTSSSGVILTSESKSTEALPGSASDLGGEQQPRGRRNLMPQLSRLTIILKGTCILVSLRRLSHLFLFWYELAV